MKLKLKKCTTCKKSKINAENYIRLNHGRYSKTCNDCREARKKSLKPKTLIIEKRPTIARISINEDLQGLTPKEVLAIVKEQESNKKLVRIPIFKGYRLCEVK